MNRTCYSIENFWSYVDRIVLQDITANSLHNDILLVLTEGLAISERFLVSAIVDAQMKQELLY